MKINLQFINRLGNWLEIQLKNKKTFLLVFGAILLVGIFLRTYNHRQWLYFDDDQANDAIIVDNYIQGKTALPELGPNMGNTKFRLGPMFYYFQITSAKFFNSTYPDVLAYPDLLFSILTIPLFYYFLKRYFSSNLSLALTGLYTISYFALKFSRFAWNTNSMPFFILLFLLALLEFLKNREKTKWFWAVALGIAVGVGVQLHAMLLVIFPLMCLAVLIFTIKSGWKVWLKWLAVIFLALLLNGGLIKHEFAHNFKNTHYFFKNAEDRSGSRAGSFVKTLALDVACHAQANTYILTTLGNKDNCNFLDKNVNFGNDRHHFKFLDDPVLAITILISLLFSSGGYFFLFKRFRNEKSLKKKYFLGLVILYSALFFVIMIPSIKDAPLRYFLPIFFLPYLFLGIMVEKINKKIMPKYSFFVIASVFSIIVATNVVYLSSIAWQLENKTRSGSGDVILGELETMRDYIIASSAPQKEAYFLGDSHYIFRFYRPMQYLAAKDGFKISRTGRVSRMKHGEPVFYIYKSFPGRQVNEVNGMPILNYRNFGQVAIYEVTMTK